MFTSTTLNSRRQQRGITLIEVSIGLIIAAIIAAAAFIAFQNNSRRAEVRDNVRQITEVIAETKQKIGLPVGYAGLSETVALNAGILSEVNNSYGLPIVMLQNAGNAERADLQWPGIPEDQCSDLVIASLEGVAQVTDGTTTLDALNGTLVDATGTPLADPLGAIGGICALDANNITFTFGRR